MARPSVSPFRRCSWPSRGARADVRDCQAFGALTSHVPGIVGLVARREGRVSWSARGRHVGAPGGAVCRAFVHAVVARRKVHDWALRPDAIPGVTRTVLPFRLQQIAAGSPLSYKAPPFPSAASGFTTSELVRVKMHVKDAEG